MEVQASCTITSMPSCCGIAEISGLGFSGASPEENLKCLITQGYQRDYYGPRKKSQKVYKPLGRSHLVFTQGGSPKNGERLYAEEFAKFLEENKLGTVVRTTREPNPVHSDASAVQLFVWTPDHAAVNEWYEKNCSKEYEEENKQIEQEALLQAQRQQEAMKNAMANQHYVMAGNAWVDGKIGVV
jgi:hypothetical protein